MIVGVIGIAGVNKEDGMAHCFSHRFSCCTCVQLMCHFLMFIANPLHLVIGHSGLMDVEVLELCYYCV